MRHPSGPNSTSPGPRQVELVLLRHGETEWSRLGRYAGLTDLALTADGQASARALGPRLAQGNYDRIVSSPLQRARSTAELLALGEVTLDLRLVERDYGDYEGKTTAEIRADAPHWHVWTDPVPNGETLAAMTHRVNSFIRDVRQSADRRVLAVAHAHLIRLVAARWLGLEPAQAALFRLGTLGIAHLGWERERPVMLSWNT